MCKSKSHHGKRSRNYSCKNCRSICRLCRYEFTLQCFCAIYLCRLGRRQFDGFVGSSNFKLLRLKLEEQVLVARVPIHIWHKVQSRSSDCRIESSQYYRLYCSCSHRSLYLCPEVNFEGENGFSSQMATFWRAVGAQLDSFCLLMESERAKDVQSRAKDLTILKPSKRCSLTQALGCAALVF